MSDGELRVRSFQSDRVDEKEISYLVELLDQQAATSAVSELRGWAHEVLAVCPGQRAVEVGSGTGSSVQRLATAVGPDGEAIGLDANEGLLAVAEDRARRAGSAARFVHGDVHAAPFADGSVDAVLCERVFQFLDRPEHAVAEIARVLRPGGRVVLIDSDWSSATLYPGDPEVLRTMESMLAGSLHNREPLAGRKLRSWLAGAGLTVTGHEARTLFLPYDMFLNAGLLALTDLAVAHGEITAEQRQQFLAGLADAQRRGEFHASVTMFAAVAHR
ncbi:methyltransferase domain-containing protein [Pseudonocardia alaniniphila]|uniref:methyltransferase domain-containing protein n=1 Tax=Pseudonocardia alaniniphila TaxID=75291 RepID=UPI002402C8F1|nr:methyltransferase domain-containing protein [Pseudonocardia alaniniphila]